MADNGHGHSHNCGSEHTEVDEELGSAFSLYLNIDTNRVECLNEVKDGSGKAVFKAWNDRLDHSEFVESDSDEELLFNIPFTGVVKLKGIIVIGGKGGQHPSEMRLFKNHIQMSFDEAQCEPDQLIELHPDPVGALEYKTKISRFSNVEHLSIHFSKNFGAGTTQVYYIGLRGDVTQAHRHKVTICNYEARANPADHKSHAFDHISHQIQ